MQPIRKLDQSLCELLLGAKGMDGKTKLENVKESNRSVPKLNICKWVILSQFKL